MTTSSTEPVYGKTYGGTAPENYERYFVPVIPAPLAADLITEAALRPGERVLDLACGTGIVTRLAAERVGRTGSVAAVDVNPGMLSVARTLVPRNGAPVQWHEANAESIPLPDESIDVGLCQLGLMFVGDPAAAVRELRRVLVPGGRALVSLAVGNDLFDRFDTVLGRHVPPAAGFVRMVFSLEDPVRAEQLFREAGFEQVAVRRHAKQVTLPPSREFLWQYISCTPMISMVPEATDPRGAALERDIIEAWRPWVKDGGLRYEQEVLVVTARKGSESGRR